MNGAITTNAAIDLKLVPCDSPNVCVLALGLNTINDGLGGWFYWDAASTATANDITVIQVTGVTTGRWLAMGSNGAQGMTYYNASGTIAKPTKKWTAIVTPTTGNGYSINISSAGFTSILNFKVTTIKANTDANLTPNVSVKSVSTTALVVNIVEGNAASIVILGIAVLSGYPLVFTNVTGLTLSVEVEGY